MALKFGCLSRASREATIQLVIIYRKGTLTWCWWLSGTTFSIYYGAWSMIINIVVRSLETLDWFRWDWFSVICWIWIINEGLEISDKRRRMRIELRDALNWRQRLKLGTEERKTPNYGWPQQYLFIYLSSSMMVVQRRRIFLVWGVSFIDMMDPTAQDWTT